jgi:hypothetical protein
VYPLFSLKIGSVGVHYQNKKLFLALFLSTSKQKNGCFLNTPVKIENVFGLKLAFFSLFSLFFKKSFRNLA